MKSNKPVRQHYVPKFILKNFANTKNIISVFDKKNSKTFNSNIDNVFVEKNFYTVNDKFNIEQYYAKEETYFSNIIQTILTKNTMSYLSDETKYDIMKFFIIQYFRTNKFRNLQEDILQNSLEKIFNICVENKIPKQIEESIKIDIAKDFVKEENFKVMKEIIEKINILMQNKKFYLLHNDSSSFFISDNPIVMNNQQSNLLGFKVPYIEIYLPISPTLAIMICDVNVCNLKDLTDIKIDITTSQSLNKLQLLNSSRYIAFEFNRNCKWD